MINVVYLNGFICRSDKLFFFFFTLQILLSEEYPYNHIAYIVTVVPVASKRLFCPTEQKGDVESKCLPVSIN